MNESSGAGQAVPGPIKEQMTPLAQWRPDDRAEMAELLEIAASRK
jgi:hypothetical protein